MSKKMKKDGEKAPGSFAKFMGSKGARIGIIVIAAILVLFFGFATYAAVYDDIFPGVTVNGVDVGGMSVSEATTTIQNEIVEPMENRELVLKCEDNEKTVSVSELCPQGIDSADIAEQAFEVGRSGGIFSKTASFVSALFDETEINAEIGVDSEILEEVVDELSQGYTTDVVETGYSLSGNTLTIIKGSGGRCVIMEKAKQQVEEAFADDSVSEVVFVIEDAEPQPVDVDEFYAELTQSPKNASYQMEDGEVVVKDEVYGIIIDKKSVETALNSNEKRVELKVETKKPDVTASELKSLLFRDVMGEWTTNYSSSSSARANNVELASRRINGRVLMPGEVFSYDQAILPRTAANGYQSAGVYVGNKVESGIGGGICQPSSTLYCAVLYSNLEIVTRTSHSLPVSYVPAGQDATIAQGYIDFKFKNNTDYPVKIVATYGNRNLTCKILGVKPAGQTVEIVNTRTGTLSPKVEKVADGSIPQGYKKTGSKGASGSTYSSRRIVRIDGKEVKNEKLPNSVYNATTCEVRVNPADMGASVDALTEYTGQPIEEKPAEGVEGSQRPGVNVDMPGVNGLPINPEGSAPVGPEVPQTKPEIPSADVTGEASAGTVQETPSAVESMATEVTVE